MAKNGFTFNVQVQPPTRTVEVKHDSAGRQFRVSVDDDVIFHISQSGVVTFYQGDAEKAGLTVEVQK